MENPQSKTKKPRSRKHQKKNLTCKRVTFFPQKQRILSVLERDAFSVLLP